MVITEPQLIKKISEYRNSGHGRKNTFHVCQGNDNRDIESHMRELYDIDIFDSTISLITKKILLIVKEWQERPRKKVLL